MTPVSALHPTSPSLELANVDVAMRARAYCGPAHGCGWTVGCDAPLAEQVELAADTGTSSYRLVRDPRTGRPAHDRHGNFVYMPQSYGNAPSAAGPMRTTELGFVVPQSRRLRSCA